MLSNLASNYSFYSKKSHSFIIAATFFFCFTPFFSFLPVHSDLQPIFLIFIFLSFGLYRRMMFLAKSEIYFLLLAVVSIIYIDIDDPFFSLSSSLGLLFAFMSYHFFYKTHLFLTQKTIFYVVLVNFVVVMIDVYMHSFYIAFITNFISDYRGGGIRGANGLAPEAGFIGGLAVFYIALSFYAKEFHGDKSFFCLNLVMSLLIIVSSKSGTGILLLFIFTFFKLLKFNVKNTIVVVVLGYSFFQLASYGWMGRAGFVIQNIFENPEKLFLLDYSTAARSSNIVLAFLSVLHYPFGIGANGYDTGSGMLIEKYNLDAYFVSGFGNVSAFAKYSIELGLFYWFLLLLVVFNSLRNDFVVKLPYVILSLSFISANFSIAFPPAWFFLASLCSSRTRNK